MILKAAALTLCLLCILSLLAYHRERKAWVDFRKHLKSIITDIYAD